MKERILVHCCCGPCATSSIQRLLDEGFEPVLCYGNSNIWPKEENEKRFGELLKVADYYDACAPMERPLEVHRLDYDHDAWRAFVKGLEDEPEHGARCLRCFEFNLRETCRKSKELGIGRFTTTLTVSRFKRSQSIFDVGDAFDGFERIDFKKKDGFARSVEMSRALGLYRQQYCGCEFSLAGCGSSDRPAQACMACDGSPVADGAADGQPVK